MKCFGWILVVFSILSFIGAAVMEHSVVGPVFWGVLGAYLISRANKKDKEKDDKDKWANRTNS